MVISELFSPTILKQWVQDGIPELPIHYQDAFEYEE
jgi:hypothetical protein